MTALDNRTLLTRFDLEIFDGISFEVSVYQDGFTPSQIWESRNDWLTFVEKSKEYFKNMTVEEQEGAQELIKYAMQRLYDKIDTWFPESIDMSSGSAIDVHFRILVTDAQEAIKKNSGITKMMIEETEKDSLKLLERLSD